ncbi:MAG: DUF433 domain-containing protein [Bacteroidota bacterium]
MELKHPAYPRITINQKVCLGKPCIRGMRFPVTTLLAYLAGGTSKEELLSEFPFLEQEDIYQALGFAARTMDDQYVSLQKSIFSTVPNPKQKDQQLLQANHSYPVWSPYDATDAAEVLMQTLE